MRRTPSRNFIARLPNWVFGADFNRLLKNLEYLVAARNKARKSIPRLRFNVTLMRSNIQELEELVSLAANLGVSCLDFRHMLIYEGLGMEQESLFFHQDLANLWRASARQKARELGISVVQCPEPFGLPAGARTPTTQASVSSLIKKAGRRFLQNPPEALRTGAYRLKNLLQESLFRPPRRNQPTAFCHSTIP